MELGIIGLPTSGKTTVFNALTRSSRPTTAISTGRLELVSASVDVPDPRVDRLSALYTPRKTTYAKVTYTDIAGLDQDLGKTGLSGELRNKLAPLDAFIHVVRAFEDDRVPHMFGDVSPDRDLEHLESELMLADMISVETQLSRLQDRLSKGARGDERQALQDSLERFERLEAALAEGVPLRNTDLSSQDRANLNGFGLLTLKPALILLNTGDEGANPDQVLQITDQTPPILELKGKLEMELSQLPPEEMTLFMAEFGVEEPARDRVVQASYQLIGLLSFFTLSDDEVRAWTLPCGATALDAAGTVHTDMARGFIRAEVVSFDDLVKAGSMAAARRAGTVHLEGKDYVVQDGDIIQIRFSV